MDLLLLNEAEQAAANQVLEAMVALLSRGKRFVRGRAGFNVFRAFGEETNCGCALGAHHTYKEIDHTDIHQGLVDESGCSRAFADAITKGFDCSNLSYSLSRGPYNDTLPAIQTYKGFLVGVFLAEWVTQNNAWHQQAA